MFSTAKEANHAGGFTFRAVRSVILDVADVLGQVSKDAIRSSENSINFMDVFNCLSTLRHVGNSDRYIANEGSEQEIQVTSWNNARLASFMDRIIQGKVTGLNPTPSQIESLRILNTTLSTVHEQHS